ncbi:MAG TPA: hypothetical protein VMD59_11290 [Acidimicrobiales bacterium]|nr:hypothetical protein [Acidimicrobiales bacterium]
MPRKLGTPVPETPVTVALPLLAVVVIGGTGIVVARRRRSAGLTA